MDNWLHTFENQDLHMGYFPGSGGNRLRRLILGHPWKTHPVNHLHKGNGLAGLSDSEVGVPKCPVPWFTDPESGNVVPTKSFATNRKILISHCMHSPLTKQIFPNRVAVKIYANLHHSLRRWWVIFGKNFLSTDTRAMTIPHLGPRIAWELENTIKFHVDYYTKFMDTAHDHAVYIIAGDNEFADFMLEEFENIRNHPAADEFDQCWNQIIADTRWQPLMQNPMLVDPAFCQKNNTNT